MKTDVRIDLDKLVHSYRENLLTVLRGFSVEPELEFLEAWVPEQDDAGSIIGLVEAARQGGLEKLTVVVSSASRSNLDLDALTAALAPFGSVDSVASGDGLELAVLFSGNAAAAPARPSSEAPAARSAPVTEKAVERVRSSDADTRSDDGVLPDGYGRALDEQVREFKYEGPLGSTALGERLEAASGSATLRVLIDPSQHRITVARHQGGGSKQQRKLLELLCRGLEGVPVQEGYDHAVVRLEHLLRRGVEARPRPGIVLPNNVSSAFKELQDLVSAIVRDYRTRQGLTTTANFYHPEPSPSWQALSDEEKMARIQAVIAGHPAGQDLRVVRVEGLQRFVLASSSAAGEITGVQLLQLESHVKRNIESTLYFEMQPRVDENKLRRLIDKGAATS